MANYRLRDVTEVRSGRHRRTRCQLFKQIGESADSAYIHVGTFAVPGWNLTEAQLLERGIRECSEEY